MTKKQPYAFIIEPDDESDRAIAAAAVLDALRLELGLDDRRDWLRVEEVGCKLRITVAPGVLDAEASR